MGRIGPDEEHMQVFGDYGWEAAQIEMIKADGIGRAGR